MLNLVLLTRKTVLEESIWLEHDYRVRPGMVTCVFNPSTVVAKTGRYL